ncbi:MAG: hypothetical protein PHU12_01400 [Candidatus Aenigmarchaeota archaeon]|nr:hypothetical protein [Candidatus Aenigmarchaeota archaeon]
MKTPKFIDERDKGNLDKLTKYLEDLGMVLEVRGTAAQKTEYADIDILARGNADMIAGALTGLFGSRQQRGGKEIASFPEKYKLTKYNIRNVGQEVRYVSEVATQRLLVAYDNSFFDISFKADNQIK